MLRDDKYDQSSWLSMSMFKIASSLLKIPISKLLCSNTALFRWSKHVCFTSFRNLSSVFEPLTKKIATLNIIHAFSWFILNLHCIARNSLLRFRNFVQRVSLIIDTWRTSVTPTSQKNESKIKCKKKKTDTLLHSEHYIRRCLTDMNTQNNMYAHIRVYFTHI